MSGSSLARDVSKNFTAKISKCPFFWSTVIQNSVNSGSSGSSWSWFCVHESLLYFCPIMLSTFSFWQRCKLSVQMFNNQHWFGQSEKFKCPINDIERSCFGPVVPVEVCSMWTIWSLCATSSDSNSAQMTMSRCPFPPARLHQLWNKDFGFNKKSYYVQEGCLSCICVKNWQRIRWTFVDK